jgi:hypothetical protein
MKTLIHVLSLAMIVISTTGCRGSNLAEREFIGMDKVDVVKMLGEPDKVEELVKDTEHIFGSIEGLWDQIEMGDKIVTWTYVTADGYKELYFLNDSSKVAGEFYWYNDPSKNPVF